MGRSNYFKTEVQKELGREWRTPENRLKIGLHAAVAIIRTAQFRPFFDNDYTIYKDVKSENALYGTSEYHTVTVDEDEITIYDKTADSPGHLYVGVKLTIQREKEKDAASRESQQQEKV